MEKIIIKNLTDMDMNAALSRVIRELKIGHEKGVYIYESGDVVQILQNKASKTYSVSKISEKEKK